MKSMKANDLPELIAAVCEHPECPPCLQDAIWDAFNNQDRATTFTADYWRCSFEPIALCDRNKDPNAAAFPLEANRL